MRNFTLLEVGHEFIFLSPNHFPVIVGTRDYVVRGSSPLRIRKWAWNIRRHPQAWAKAGIRLSPATPEEGCGR